MIKRDAYHRENFENVLFWQKLVGIALDYIRETLVALFHNDAWKATFIFDNINMDAILEFSDEEMHNKVYVRFVVNKDGDVEQVVIDRAGTYCPPCNKEALRLVKSMPKWTPGIVDGRAVSMYFRLPIIFSVQ
jgi:protein TonB